MNKFKIGDTVLVKSKEEIEKIIDSSQEEWIKSESVSFVSDFCGMKCEVGDVEWSEESKSYHILLTNLGEHWWYADTWIIPLLKDKLDKLLNE